MQPIVTDGVALSVCRFVCLSVGLLVDWSVCHDRQPCKNGWTDQDAVWELDSGGPKQACVRWECILAPPGEYDWTVRRCGLMSRLFEHLLL